MLKRKERTFPVTLHLTPEQVEALLHQVTQAEEKDWMDDPCILQMLAERDRHVTAEIRAGRFATLEDLQKRWAKKKTQARAKKRHTI